MVADGYDAQVVDFVIRRHPFQAGLDLLRVAVHAVALVLLDELPFVGEVFVAGGHFGGRDAFGAARYRPQPAQVAAGGDAPGVGFGFGAQRLHADVDAGRGQIRRRLKVLAVGRHNPGAVIGAQSEKVGVGEGQAHLGGHKRRLVARPQQPDLRGAAGRFVGSGGHLVKGMVVGQ